MNALVDSFNQVFSSLGASLTNSLTAIPELMAGVSGTLLNTVAASLAQTSLMPLNSFNSLGSFESFVPAAPAAPAAQGSSLLDILLFPIPQILS